MKGGGERSGNQTLKSCLSALRGFVSLVTFANQHESTFREEAGPVAQRTGRRMQTWRLFSPAAGLAMKGLQV